MLVQLFFKKIIRIPVEDRYLMLLQDNVQKDRYLRIYIGEKEGQNVEHWIQSIIPPRPMTYDLISEILNLSDTVNLTKIIIDGCCNEIFYAKMYFNVCGEEKVIDCRPSDAIAIGLRMSIPIYAELCVLERHGIILA